MKEEFVEADCASYIHRNEFCVGERAGIVRCTGGGVCGIKPIGQGRNIIRKVVRPRNGPNLRPIFAEKKKGRIIAAQLKGSMKFSGSFIPA